MINPIDGTIRSVQGVNPGPSSGISYTIVYIENGSAVVLSGQVPVFRQWPEEVDIDGQACVGKKVAGFISNEGRIWWFFAERPASRQCGTPQPLRQPDPSDPLDPARRDNVFTGTVSGSSSTPAGGGES